MRKSRFLNPQLAKRAFREISGLLGNTLLTAPKNIILMGGGSLKSPAIFEKNEQQTRVDRVYMELQPDVGKRIGGI